MAVVFEEPAFLVLAGLATETFTSSPADDTAYEGTTSTTWIDSTATVSLTRKMRAHGHRMFVRCTAHLSAAMSAAATGYVRLALVHNGVTTPIEETEHRIQGTTPERFSWSVWREVGKPTLPPGVYQPPKLLVQLKSNGSDSLYLVRQVALSLEAHWRFCDFT